MKIDSNFLKKNKFDLLIAIFFLIFFIIVFILVYINFFGRFSAELIEGFKNDGGIYFAIGKGITHGLKPYTDLFETKPPLIFYFSALAYSISGGNNFYFVNVSSFIFLLLFFLLPFAFLILLILKNHNINKIKLMFLILSIFAFSLILSGFLQNYGGHVYCEMFCATFIGFYFLNIYFNQSKKINRIVIYLLNSFLLFLAIFTKEIYAFVAIFGALLLIKNKKDFFNKIFFPFLTAGIFGLIFLLSTGLLLPYFNIYLSSMLKIWFATSSSSISSVPLILKFFMINETFKYYWYYSYIFTFLIPLLFLFTSFVIIKKNLKSSIKFKIYLVTVLILNFFSTNICLALGTGFQWEHQAPVCVSIYLLWFFFAIEFFFEKNIDLNIKKKKIALTNVVLFAISILSSMSCITLGSRSYLGPKDYTQQTIEVKQKAKYVDEVLDKLEENNYLYIGFGRGYDYMFAYTKHDPIGPAFFQSAATLSKPGTFLYEKFKVSLENINFIVYANCRIQDEMKTYLDNYISYNFTTEKPSQIETIIKPSHFKDKVYFRKGVF